MSSKELIVVGGPNGAGITTFALQYVHIHKLQFLSADAIAEEIAPENPSTAKIAAGRAFLKRFELAIRAGQRLVVESTLSGRSLVHGLQLAKERGYSTEIIFVFLDSEESCVERVRERANKGGHGVPEADVRRRFRRSITNFWELYRTLVDSWALMYNSQAEPIEIASSTSEIVTVHDVDRFERFKLLGNRDSDGI
jgi:predicted ABC-type ATPase